MNRIWKVRYPQCSYKEMINQKGFTQNFDILKMPKSYFLTPSPTLGPDPGVQTAHIKGIAIEIL